MRSIQWHAGRCSRNHMHVKHCKGAGASGATENPSHGWSFDKERPVWEFGFQCNERYLKWDDSAQVRLLKLHCSKTLGWDLEKVDQELNQLMSLLPDLVVRLERIKADLLIKLLTSQQDVAASLLALRAALPGADVASMVARLPALLTDMSAEEITSRMHSLRVDLELGSSELEMALETEPRLMFADARALKAEVARLLPGKDARDIITRMPNMVAELLAVSCIPSIDDEYAV